MIASNDKLYLGTDLIYPATPQPYKVGQEFSLRRANYVEDGQASEYLCMLENFDFYRLVATQNLGQSYSLEFNDGHGYSEKYKLLNIVEEISQCLVLGKRFTASINQKSVQVAENISNFEYFSPKVITDTAVPLFFYSGGIERNTAFRIISA